ncbi:uncharacterized protein LOC143265384 [Megachile rotundata]|uniref:uncharacterized protein LOC143265384 n=1 Tax=Megachile rotundata TaxID=143995 RepID=UPI003FD63FB0
MLRKSEELKRNAFELPCYRVFREYLIVLGQYPYQTKRSHTVNLTVISGISISILIPVLLQFFTSIRDKDMDALMESVPYMATGSVSAIKLLNHNINRKKFDTLFDRMCKQWEISEINDEIHVLNEVTQQGTRMGTLYRSKHHDIFQ